MKYLIPLACAALLQATLPTTAQAGLIFTMQEAGSDVVATGSGSADITGLTAVAASTSSLVWGLFPLGSGSSVLTVGPTTNHPVDFYTVSGAANFGTGSKIFADTGTGDILAIIANFGLYVPRGYVSGTALSGSATWLNQSFTSLGVTPGTYTWTWGSGGHADSATLIIGSVPEPGTLALGLAAALAYRAGGRRKPHMALAAA